MMRINRLLAPFHRTLLLGLMVGIAVGAPLALVAYIQTPLVFTTVQPIQIFRTEPKGLLPMKDVARFESEDYLIYKRTQRDLLLSPHHLKLALKSKDLAIESWVEQQADPVSRLAQILEVKVPDTSEVMTISLSLPDRNAAAKIVGSVVGVYGSHVIDATKALKVQRIAQIESCIRDEEERERKIRMELAALASSLGTLDETSLSVPQRLLLEQVASIHSELWKTALEILAAESSAQNSSNDISPSESHLDKVISPKQIESLERKRNLLKEEMDVLFSNSKALGRSSIDVEILKHELESITSTVKSLRDELERSKIEMRSPPRIVIGFSSTSEIGDSKLRTGRVACAGLIGLLAAAVFVLLRRPTPSSVAAA